MAVGGGGGGVLAFADDDEPELIGAVFFGLSPFPVIVTTRMT